MVFPPIHWFQGIEGAVRILSDLEYLAIKEFDGKLTGSLSSEFTTNATQITVTPATGKTFYHLRSRLYPVLNTAVATTDDADATARADVELKNESTVIDVLTFEAKSQSSLSSGSGANSTLQPETNIIDSLAGDGAKTMTLVSTNNTGTFRVSLIGVTENDADSPKA